MKFVKIVVLLFVTVSILQAQEAVNNSFELKTFEDSVSYSIGRNIAKNIEDPSVKINFDVVIQAMHDTHNGKSALTEPVMQKVLIEFNRRMTADRNKQMEEVKEKNKKAGDEFLAANKNKEGVKTLESGLQYKVIKSGNGVSPKEEDTVKVHYKGTLIDGREFDSSYKRNEPTEFPVNRVIKGWTEALQLMKVGDKWELYIPYDLAYGENQAGELIQPYSTLIFEVELLEVKPVIK
jgi:FKBP-type peptidyl-prolyl cis-trans isomerase FklB